MRLTVTLSALVAAVIAVVATVLLRAVPVTAQAEPDQAPATATEPAALPGEPEPVTVIRSGSGCVVCPGERLSAELPVVTLPKPPPGDPGSPTP